MYVLLIAIAFIVVAIVQSVKNDVFLAFLGQRIRTIREAKKLTQLDLGLLCNNHAEQIGRIERGEHNVTICSLLVIANAFDTSLKELLDFKY